MKKLQKIIAASFLMVTSFSTYADWDRFAVDYSGDPTIGNRIYLLDSTTGEAQLVSTKVFYGNGWQISSSFVNAKTGELVIDASGGQNIYNPKTNTWRDVPAQGQQWQNTFDRGPHIDDTIRKTSNGDIHIGENSFVVRETSTKDTIFSSVGTLQIGDSPNHRTIVQGTLEIQDPTAPNHAATRRYVDSATALSMAMTTIPKSYNGKTVFGVGTGYFNGENAVAFGLSKNLQGKGIQMNVNVGHTNSAGFSGSAGVGIEF